MNADKKSDSADDNCSDIDLGGDRNKNCVNRLLLTLTIGEDRYHEKARTESLRT